MVFPASRVLPATLLFGALLGGGGCACLHDTRYATENSNLRDDVRLFATPRCDPSKQYACATFDIVVEATHPLPASLLLELAPSCTRPVSLSKPSTPGGFWRFEADLECGALVPERRHRLVLRGTDSVYARSDFRYTQYSSESCSD